MKKFLSEFKEFAMRGNVMDLAVGVIVGGAFSNITNSLINDVIMPFIGLFVGETTFANLYFYIGDAQIMIGNFIQAVFNFVVLAFVVFCLVKILNKLRRKKEEEPAPAVPPEPSAEEKLLTEIRDLLKEGK